MAEVVPDGVTKIFGSDVVAVDNVALPVMEVTAEVTEDLGSEVNVLFNIDAPPVTTEETLAASSYEGSEEAMIPLVAEEGQAVFCARVDARTSAKPGRRVRLSLDPARFHYFDKDAGARLGAIEQTLASAGTSGRTS
jgi:hypothetical protein